jgi:acetyltransferase-like isoleucine patch superfamily enzyme
MDRRLIGLLRSLLDPRAWLGLLRLLHYHNYSHVRPRRSLRAGPDVRLAPNVSFTHAERIEIGARSNIGARSAIWAGREGGRISIGEDCLFGPQVFITASNYRTELGTAIWRQATIERDITIGRDVWLGTGVIVLPGVSIGDGAIVGAGSIVTRSIPAGAVAVGNPARVVGTRGPVEAERGALTTR